MRRLLERLASGGVRTRSEAEKARGYVHSYVVIRIAVGVVGLALPIGLFFGEWLVLARQVRARDSLSSYYHSSMRDWFVGSLAVIGVLLITYMADRWRTVDFVASTTAGAALLVVAAFPTARDGMHARHCGDPGRVPAGCTDLETRLGELRVSTVHHAAAGVALVLLAVIAAVFGARAWWSRDAAERSRRRAITMFSCASVILLGVGCAAADHWTDRRVGPLTLTYTGEVLAIAGFALAWFVQGFSLRRWLTATTG